MDGLKKRITNEPVMTMALVQAAVAMGVGFGLNWTPEQIGLVLAFTAAMLSFIARQQVTPVAKAEAQIQDAKDDARAKAIVERAMSPDLTAEEWSSLQELRAERDNLRTLSEIDAARRRTP
jgi:hypothetical protein